MAGIQNYFHGETGIVAEQKWFVDKDGIGIFINLEGSQHRSCAIDYGSDIGIDPNICIGDEVIYLRFNEYEGLWTRADCTEFKSVESACQRVLSNRRHMDDHQRFYGKESTECWIKELGRNSGMPVDFRGPNEGLFSFKETPRTRISTFLSYSSINVLLARQFFSSIRVDADIDLWFDLAQPGEAATHRDHAERWLKEAVYESKGFLLLLTKAAAESHWVEKETALSGRFFSVLIADICCSDRESSEAN